jgi:hypothetical protein
MTRMEVGIIYDTSRRRRVVLFRRMDGSYGFDEEYFDPEAETRCWLRRDRYAEGYYPTQESLIQEMRKRVPWLGRRVA